MYVCTNVCACIHCHLGLPIYPKKPGKALSCKREDQRSAWGVQRLPLRRVGVHPRSLEAKKLELKSQICEGLRALMSYEWSCSEGRVRAAIERFRGRSEV